MAYFRCYFIRTDGHIQSVKVLEAEDDAAAILEAQSAFADQDYPIFELWDGKRRVHLESKALMLN
ncbi:MAG TPA: hypothetical protein VNF99_07000 [Stellaceae bacterium]|nr:hypothetical protein [Stellaceae bacterium]